MLRKAVIPVFILLWLAGTVRAAREVSGRVTWHLLLHPPEGVHRIRLWLPYPPSNRFQHISGLEIRGNYRCEGFYTDQRGNPILYFEWKDPHPPEAEVTVTWAVRRREVVRRDFSRQRPLPPDPAVFREYLSGNRYINLDDPRLAEILAEVLPGKRTVVEKARALYLWVIAHLRRDPRVKGCGPGIVCDVLRRGCGKCADLNSVFVALCRAAGIPAREVFGLRLGREPRETLTGAQHCWTEFFVPGYGWVPADPADVLKAALQKDLDPLSPELGPLREYYFGAVDAYRVELSRGRDLLLNPPQSGPPVNYFVYPYLEYDGKPVDLFTSPTVDFEIRWETRNSAGSAGIFAAGD